MTWRETAPLPTGPMSVAFIEQATEYLASIAGDDEKAHGFEDTLRADVLRAIADRHPQGALLAMAVLKTSEIDFARWCA